MKTQKCTLCENRSLPGLLKGAGKCKYHWMIGVWGKEWADAADSLTKNKDSAKQEPDAQINNL